MYSTEDLDWVKGYSQVTENVGFSKRLQDLDKGWIGLCHFPLLLGNLKCILKFHPLPVVARHQVGNYSSSRAGFPLKLKPNLGKK